MVSPSIADTQNSRGIFALVGSLQPKTKIPNSIFRMSTHSKIFGYGLAKCPPTAQVKNTKINNNSSSTTNNNKKHTESGRERERGGRGRRKQMLEKQAKTSERE